MESTATTHSSRNLTPYEAIVLALVFCCGLTSFLSAPSPLTVNLGPISIFPFRFFLIALLTLLAIGNILGRVSLRQSNQTGLFRGFLVFWVLYGTAGLLLSRYPAEGLSALLRLAFGVVTVLTIDFSIRSSLTFTWIRWAIILAFIGLVAIGVWEVTTGNHLASSNVYGAVREDIRDDPSGPFHNPNDYATALAVASPFLLTTVPLVRPLTRIALLSLILCGIGLIILAGSRANIAAMLVVIGVFTLLYVRPTGKSLSKAGAVVLALILLGAIPVVRDGFVRPASEQLFSLGQEYQDETGSTYVRENLVRNALQFVYQTGGLGIGPGNELGWMRNYAELDTGPIVSFHNWWIEVLADYGIFIFVFYLAFHLWLYIRLWQTRSCLISRVDQANVNALILVFAGLPIAALSSSSLLGFEFYWFLVGVSLSMTWLFRRGQKA